MGSTSWGAPTRPPTPPALSSPPGGAGVLPGHARATAPTRLLPRTPQLLRLLEDLAFGLDRGRDDQLRLLQLADAPGADRAHAGPDGADEVQGAVLGERRAEQDLLQRAGHPYPDPGAARQVGVRGGHAPVIAAPGRLDRARERRADHHGVGARRERLADVAAG